MQRTLFLSLSALLGVFYVYILSLSMHARVSREYQLFYIDQTLKYWPKTHGLNYKLGTPIDFSGKQKVVYLSRTGWSSPESNGVWTIGKLASLFLTIDNKVTRDIQIQLNLKPIINNQHPTLYISITVNDSMTRKITYHQSDKNKIKDMYTTEFIIPSKHFNNKQFTRIDIRIENPVAPSSISNSHDTRTLGVMIRKITLSAV